MRTRSQTRWSVALAAALLVGPASLSAEQRDELPDHDQQQLKAFREPSLQDLAKRNPGAKFYRFIWLRTFHSPIVIRVSIRSHDRAEVVFKRGSGHAGYGIGKLVSTKNRQINNRQHLVDAFLSSVDNADLWKLPSQEEKTDELRLDGAIWTFEAAEGNRYHVVSRWSPRRSRELWELGLMFCTVSDFRPYYDEVY